MALPKLLQGCFSSLTPNENNRLLSGRPLVVHVHSTEFDRSGEAVNQRIYEIERRGMPTELRRSTNSSMAPI